MATVLVLSIILGNKFHNGKALLSGRNSTFVQFNSIMLSKVVYSTPLFITQPHQKFHKATDAEAAVFHMRPHITYHASGNNQQSQSAGARRTH